ncbi:MAG: fatty acid desaturase [Acidobacteria bacterium]|nr:fatty acid desaturase [Acidobacteriota bacterium]MCB9397919.1 fatty acid desaturase [Acidobacteriota bacterium]
MRSGKDLINATRAFTDEGRLRSWLHVISTAVFCLSALSIAAFAPLWPIQLIGSLLAALLMVRLFITYHDYMHGAILRQSIGAKIFFFLYSGLVLVPASSWRKTHNFHHAHVGEISLKSVGAFPLVTLAMWHETSWLQRLRYRIIRHPLTLLLGYVTIFAFSICLLPFFREPKKHLDSLFALFAHGALIALLGWAGGFQAVFFAILLPMFLSGALGAYLFFAQHSYPDMQVLSESDWSFSEAALASSSYLQMSKIMHWFTGNIGYHHVHHLNVKIPFYRLPEAMAAIPELQSPGTTTLGVRDIWGCFQACLWDEENKRMVSYRDARRFKRFVSPSYGLKPLQPTPSEE